MADHLAEKKKYREARAKYGFADRLIKSQKGLSDEYHLWIKISYMDDYISRDATANKESLATQIQFCEDMLENNFDEAISTFYEPINRLEEKVNNIIIPETLIPFLEKLANKFAQKEKYDTAIDLLEFRLDIPEEKTKDTMWRRMVALQCLAAVMLGQGDYAKIYDEDGEMAEHWYNLSLEFFDWLGDHKNLALTYRKLSELMGDQNRSGEISSFMKKSEEHDKLSTPLRQRWPLFGVKIAQAGFVAKDGELVQDRINLALQNVGKLTWRQGRKIRLKWWWTTSSSRQGAYVRVYESPWNISPEKTEVMDVSVEFPHFDGRYRIAVQMCPSGKAA